MGASSSLRFREFLVVRNRARLKERWGRALAQQDGRPEVETAEAVSSAVDRTSLRHLTPHFGPQEAPARPDERLSRFPEAEVEVVAAYSHQLEGSLEERQSACATLTERCRQLDELLRASQSEVEELKHAVANRDEHLERTNRQLEVYAADRASLLHRLELVTSRRSYQLIEKAERAVRSLPRGERLLVTTRPRSGG